MWIDWQTLTALSIVVIASGLLANNVRNWLRGTGPSGCSACPSRGAPPLRIKALVQIGPKPSPDNSATEKLEKSDAKS